MKHLATSLFLFLFAASVYADDIATIRAFLDNPTDDATALHSVYIACLNLTRTGTAEAVPTLKQLLADERFSTAARTALINIPGDEGVKALRESLSTLQGRNQIAVIQTLGNVRDEESVRAIAEIIKSAEDKELIEAGYRALGNIATMKHESLFVLLMPIQGDRQGDPVLTESLLNAADRLRQDGSIVMGVQDQNTAWAMSLYSIIARLGSETGKDAGWLGLALLEEPLPLVNKPYMATIEALLVHSHRWELSLKALQRLVLELQSPDTSSLVLDHMGNLPLWQQAALVRNLGARQEAEIVPALIEMLTQNGQWQESGAALRLAAVQALGEIGDLRAVDALLDLAVQGETAARETADGRRQTAAEELADAARESLKLFAGEEFEQRIVAMLYSNDQRQIMIALDVISARRIVAPSEKLKALVVGADPAIRTVAHGAYANTIAPTVVNIEFLLRRLQLSRRQFLRLPPAEMEQVDAELNALREAVLILCRRADDRENAADLFMVRERYDLVDFYLDCLFQLGGEAAARVIASVAMGTDDALTDKATQLLGQWTTPEVAPFLIDIAEHHPVERFRSRTLRGYLRVIRQMGLPVEQKVAMAERAVSVANAAGLPDADRVQAAQVLEHFRAMLAGE